MTSATQRLRRLFSPEYSQELLGLLSETLSEHFHEVLQGRGPVQRWEPPHQKIERAGQRLDEASRSTDQDSFHVDRIRDLLRESLAAGQNLHHPHYIGHQVPGPIPLAGVFDAIATITNQVMAVYEMGPWATAVERALIDRMGATFGLPTGQFAGLITSGGSIANLTALLTARNVVHAESWKSGVAALPVSPVILVQQDAHYCIARAVGILGLGTNQLVRIGLDSQRRMDPDLLEDSLRLHRERGIPVTAVVACACATPIGAFDPLESIAEICRRYDVWLHVDAAHGAAAAFSPQYRHLVAGLGQADSLICDAHKMMHVPALCAFVFYRDKAHRFAAFQQDAPYLFDPSALGMAEYDCGLMTMECTKRAAAYGLWGTWATLGPQVFADLIDVTFSLAEDAWELLQNQPDFEAPYRPQCNIVVFRHTPESVSSASWNDLNREVRRQLIESGEFYISQTTIEGVAYLRLTVINPLTDLAMIEELLKRIRTLAARPE